MAKKSEKTQKQQYGKAEQTYRCALPKIPERALPAGLPDARERLIRYVEKKWVNGTVLHYYFFDRQTDGDNGSWVGAAAQKEAVREAFQTWKDLGIGLEFLEVSNREEAEVRIGFMQGDGAWSYVGRDIIDIASDPNERTMNFGWDLTTDYGRDTALHEIGHTLGFPHEHQNPFSGIEWDEEAVYEHFRGYPNYWDEQTTDWNILRKIPSGAVTGSEWDPDSIMHYYFEAGLIKKPVEYAGGLFPESGLSEHDIAEVRKFYPSIDKSTEPELKAYESQRIMIGAGEQINFRIRPEFSRTYTIQTFGVSDTVMVLFEDDDGQKWYIAGDDDSGYRRNAKIETRLFRGREYILRVRLYFSELSGQAAVLMY
jgi:hypothetical protein